jgi:uncharacterized protein (TIGR00375 family)
MKFIADFHIHSHFSRATSKNLAPRYLDYWARMKGISVVGSGDFTHPGWTAQLKEQLEPAEDGLFKLKQEFRTDESLETPFLPRRDVRFMLTAEISNIYKKNDRVRKVHNVIFAPDFETAEGIQRKLTAIGGNITSDGRPILGLDSRDLLEMALDVSERIFFVPAHIWTPWFSALGSKSGFDSIAECYDDLAHHIYAVETGLSTDPPMNWMCGFLDDYTLLSNSDAHSPERLGRNANRFNTELSYEAMMEAIKTGDPERFHGTIDLFPQEGKYHYDGHRKCGICWDPVETLKHHGICSGCGKKVTVGVMNRVVQLSDREHLSERRNRLPFKSIIPLKEMLGELEGVGPNSKKVAARYMALIKKGVPELELLLDTTIEEIARLGGEDLAEAVRRMRNREIHIKEGYDGEYGVIKVFAENETPMAHSRNTLFKELAPEQPAVPVRREMINFDLEEFRRLSREEEQRNAGGEDSDAGQKNKVGLNPGQLAAVEHFKGPALVIAGPGTGKTRVLTYRVLHLIEKKTIDPGHILAVTFTNKAAAEIRGRLDELTANKKISAKPAVSTFHALGYMILRELEQVDFSILDGEDKKQVLRNICGVERSRVAGMMEAIAEAKQGIKRPGDIEDKEVADVYLGYQAFLEEQHLHDLEDLVTVPVRMLEEDEALAAVYRERFQWVLIDEYQDINQAQYRLIRCLAPGVDGNLCAIGDPDQAIYGFRGADVRYINQFQTDYPGAAVYRLKQSYRCSDSILRASGDVMGRGSGSGGLLTGMEQGVKIKIMRNPTYRGEAEFVARTIEQMMGGLRFFSMDTGITEGNKDREIDSLSDFAVLCRVKGQMETLEKAFMDHSIPYQTIGEEPFFKQEPVASILDMLKLLRHPGHSFLKSKLVDKGIIKDDWQGEGGLWERLAGGKSVKRVLSEVIERYFNNLEDQDERLVKRLLDLAGEYGGDMEKFLQLTVLGTAADTYRGGMESVALMTLHAAKGLEFKAVFIVGCEEGLLPYSLFKSRVSDPEEERRLLYVGMTRARKFLFLSHAEKRVLRGREYTLERSPFLNGIEQQLIELSRREHKKKEEKAPLQRKLFDMD